MGKIGFNGDINTGLTLRTIRIANGIAEVRAGATLLSDSIPEAEEEETRVKASALIRALKGQSATKAEETNPVQQKAWVKGFIDRSPRQFCTHPSRLFPPNRRQRDDSALWF